MIIAGAGSAGKETLGIYTLGQKRNDVIFYDESPAALGYVFGKFKVIGSVDELKTAISENPEFCVGIGNPRRRKKMFEKLISLNGIPINIAWHGLITMSELSENGSVFQPGIVISYDVKIGKSCMIHANTSIGHKVKIGDFVNISPLCSVIGPCIIGNETYIGAGSVIHPGIIIGHNAFITPGSIVNKDIKDFETF